MRRSLTLLMAAGLAWAATAVPALAQVAAPSLNPVPSFTTAPGNPAVLSWDVPSRIGAGISTVEFTTPGAPVDPAADGTATLLRAQWVGEMFAAGASLVSLDVDVDPALGGGSITVDFTTVQGAVQFGEWVSLGYGQDGEKLEDTTAMGGVSEETTPQAGATVRLGEVFYLGVVSGTSTVETGGAEAERDVTRVGLAYLWRSNTDGFRVEINQETQDSAATPFNVDKEEGSGFSVEAMLSNVVLSVDSFETDFTLADGTANGTEEIQTIAISWAPESGLALGVSVTDFESTTGGPAEISITTLGASWLF